MFCSVHYWALSAILLCPVFGPVSYSALSDALLCQLFGSVSFSALSDVLLGQLFCSVHYLAVSDVLLCQLCLTLTFFSSPERKPCSMFRLLDVDSLHTVCILCYLAPTVYMFSGCIVYCLHTRFADYVNHSPATQDMYEYTSPPLFSYSETSGTLRKLNWWRYSLALCD